MEISEMPIEKQLKHYKELLEKRIATENIKEKLETKLEKEITRNAFKKAGDLFSFPFKKGAFAALLEAILFLGATIIFAGCGFFVIWAILFCAIVDFLYIILYGLAYPCMILYFALFKKTRVKSLEKKLKKVENTLSHMTEKETLQKKIRSLEPEKVNQPIRAAHILQVQKSLQLQESKAQITIKARSMNITDSIWGIHRRTTALFRHFLRTPRLIFIPEITDAVLLECF